MLCFMTLHKLFTPEFTRGYWAPCSTSENVQNGLEHQHKNIYFCSKVQNSSTEANYRKYLQVKRSKWANSLCYVKIYFRYGILEVKNLQKDDFLL